MKKNGKLNETIYDEVKYRTIERFREQDPMTLSNHELESAIDYMLAYRWALDGDESVLKDYIEASKLRRESRQINKKLIRLTEGDLHRLVKESVRKVLREFNPDEDYDYPTECPYCGSNNIECIGGLGISERWVCNDCGEEFEPYDFPEPPQGDGANGACLW